MQVQKCIGGHLEFRVTGRVFEMCKFCEQKRQHPLFCYLISDRQSNAATYIGLSRQPFFRLKSHNREQVCRKLSKKPREDNRIKNSWLTAERLCLLAVCRVIGAEPSRPKAVLGDGICFSSLGLGTEVVDGPSNKPGAEAAVS